MTRRTRNGRTVTEAQLRAWTEQGLNWVQISEICGLPVWGLRCAGSVLGIRSRGRSDISRTNELPGWVDRLSIGHTLENIASDVGISKRAAFNALKKAKLPTSVIAAVRAKHAEAA